jgi:hypothetical protein
MIHHEDGSRRDLIRGKSSLLLANPIGKSHEAKVVARFEPFLTTTVANEKILKEF